MKANVLKWSELVLATGAELRTVARLIVSQAGKMNNEAFIDPNQDDLIDCRDKLRADSPHMIEKEMAELI